MINTSEEKARAKTSRETEAKAKRRATQAQIVAGLQNVLEADEQLLAFTRGLIAGGLRGKLTVGFEALFAPYVNVGLTERRIVLQHVQHESGKPSQILPHSFPLSEIQSIAFGDIETFGGEPAGRLTLRMYNDNHFRLRFRGADNVESAQSIADVFGSLTKARPKARTSPTQSVCPHCDQILDHLSRFCPYCGQPLDTGQEDSEQKAAEPSIPQPLETPMGYNMDHNTDYDHESESTTHAVENAAPPVEPVQPPEEVPPAEQEAVAGEVPAETVAPAESAEPSTEGHEAAAHSGDPDSIILEGDNHV